MKAKKNLFTIISLLIIGGVGFGLYKLFTFMPDFAMPPMPTPVVTVDKPQLRTVTDFYEFTGTAGAVEEVQVRARVQGYLQKIHFDDGSDVSKGDLLFEIERESFQAKRDQADAMLKSSQAEMLRAQLDYERVQEAVKTHAVSKQEVTTRKAEWDKAQASVMANEAALVEAELNLSYTKIHSPIDGRISRRMVDAGNLVGAGEQTLLATVVKLQPIYINFYVSEGLLLEGLEKREVNGQSSFKFYAGLENETGYPHEGVLTYMDNTVDAGTGTILIRGDLANAKKKILPGMFVRVKVPVGQQADAVVVNERAIGTDIGGKYLLLVDKDNRVERRPVQIGRQIDNMRVVASGLSADERYILKGVQFVFPGMEVNPQMVGTEPPPMQNPQTPSK
ncbi:MAG: efflux RND transporter periplasmic adaptor subunit [Planctomycetota bacterium]|jgi:RND family efflux transporter MFP subunit